MLRLEILGSRLVFSNLLFFLIFFRLFLLDEAIKVRELFFSWAPAPCRHKLLCLDCIGLEGGAAGVHGGRLLLRRRVIGLLLLIDHLRLLHLLRLLLLSVLGHVDLVLLKPLAKGDALLLGAALLVLLLLLRLHH